MPLPRGQLAHVEVGDPPEPIDARPGDHGLPVRQVPGPPGIHAVGIETARGEIATR